ncbi:hypothetical protein V2G26_019603 [Clonostachys chloroleuca]
MMRRMRGVSRTTSELLSKIITGHVDAAFAKGPVKCHFCGRRTRSSQGMLKHLRQNAKCQERRVDAASSAGHPFIMEHPGGSANHLQISLPDSPPPVAKSTTNVPEDNMALSDPVPLEEQNFMPAPLEDQNSMPAPLEDQNSMPALLEDQNSMKHTELQHGLLESPMPSDAPLNAGDVTLQQGPDCLMPANSWWPDVQDPSGSEVPAPGQEFINAQFMAVQKAHSSLFQQIPVTNADTGFICPSYLTAVPVMQQPPPISMGFEAPLVLEPTWTDANSACTRTGGPRGI